MLPHHGAGDVYCTAAVTGGSTCGRHGLTSVALVELAAMLEVGSCSLYVPPVGQGFTISCAATKQNAARGGSTHNVADEPKCCA
jgi:hypothetical protein